MKQLSNLSETMSRLLMQLPRYWRFSAGRHDLN